MATVQKGEVTISDYLLERLVQLGVKSAFGVPGDYNLAFLDFVEDHPNIAYVGCCNELNAGYAADGYARVTGKVGAVITTFGVGELSAANAIAGAHSERVPVVHIVGVPSTALQAHKSILHHTLGDAKFDAFYHVAQNITCATGIIMNGAHAAEEIDHALTTMLLKARPCYITIPTDLVHTKISAKPLSTPLTLAVEHPNKESTEDYLTDRIVQMLEAAKKPVILVDGCAIRYHVIPEVEKLIEKTGLTFFTTPMGKAGISEANPHFGGVYVGNLSLPPVKEAFESADFILAIGTLKSDINSGSFSWRMPGDRTVELHSDHVIIQYGQFEGVTFQTVLPLLIEKVKPAKASQKITVEPFTQATQVPHTGKITQEGLWPLIGSFLKEDDVVVGETGTSCFGLIETKMPKGVTFAAQVLWGSIGWAGGSFLGTSVAAAEAKRRSILCTGEGSWMLSVQELSTVIRHKLKPIIFLINNEGYTIERMIHGAQRGYNDVAMWRWTELLHAFGAAEGSYATYQVSTFEELGKLLKDPEFAAGDKIQFVEMFLDKMDAPRVLLLSSKGAADIVS